MHPHHHHHYQRALVLQLHPHSSLLHGDSVQNVTATTVYCDLKCSLRIRTEQLTEAGGVGLGVGTGSGP